VPKAGQARCQLRDDEVGQVQRDRVQSERLERRAGTVMIKVEKTRNGIIVQIQKALVLQTKDWKVVGGWLMDASLPA
jgi:hypothetical protein